jgi:hypothetical protein
LVYYSGGRDQEDEIQSQPGTISLRPYLGKSPSQKRADRVAQDVGYEFKPQFCKKKKKSAGHPCLMPVILATWETEIWRIPV